MRIEDVSFDEEKIFWVSLPEQTKIHAGAVKLDLAQSSVLGKYILRQGDHAEAVSLSQQSQAIDADLERQFRYGYAHYEIVKAEPQNGCAKVQMVFFRKPKKCVNDFFVIVSEELRKKFLDEGLNEAAFAIPSAVPEDLSYFIGAKENKKGQGDSFVLYAKGWSLEVDLAGLQDRQFVQTYKIRRNRHNIVPRNATLFQGNLKFLNEEESRTAQSVVAVETFKQMLETCEIGDYVKYWNIYGDIEGDILLERARRIGILKFKNCEPVEDGGECMRFYLEERFHPIMKTLSNADSFCIVKKDDLPEYLVVDDMSWTEYITEAKMSSKNDSYEFVALDSKLNAIILKCNKEYENQCMIIYDITGNRKSLERQMDARARIASGEAGMYHLRFLLEGNTEKLPRNPYRRRINALTPFVQNKVFNVTPPTEMQVRAVDIALNTPDIALIQGPPGTGKTTVIAAIIERINEEFDKNHDVKGQILVSAFQHDAVENLMEKLSVNALPMYKFGGRRSDEEEGRDVNRVMGDWIDGLCQRIQEKYPNLAMSKKFQHAEKLYIRYLERPYTHQARELLSVLEEFSGALSSNLCDTLRAVRQKYDSAQNVSDMNPNNDRLGVIRSLRITPETVMDDGKKRAGDFLAVFQDELEEEEKALLYVFLMGKKVEPEFYERMEKLKRKYLLKYLPMPEYHQAKIDTSLDKLYKDIHKEIQLAKTYTDKKQEILSKFLYALEYDPVGARESILECTPVYPATVQQSEGTEIRIAKGVAWGDNPEFDTVIVDEAARSTPMDLMIPMANAKRRIILVGDHKQLPHILDDEICRRMEEDEKGKQSDFDEKFDILKSREESLFEYLFRTMQKMEKRDGIPRTVTLDQQFRMHPLIGDFVSRYFYDGKVFSPRKENEFCQELPKLDGKPVAWLDVAHNEGNETRKGTSRIRVAEARVAADLLNLWLNDPAGKGLSFGIISFYKAQINEIYRALADCGIVEDAEEKTLKEEYRYLEVGGKRKERLRIGTVDAFQGMEFDVVLLLMVRTHELPLPELEGDRDYNRIFGHLRSEKRLCVSMSRGKKVLVVVGDRALAQSEAARNELGIPELSAFADLCETSGKII